MAYTSDIPKPGDLISQSQPLLRQNCNALESFGNGYAILTNQVAAPSSGTIGAGNDALYTLTNATTTTNEMYIHKQSLDAPTDIPFTASKMSNTAYASCANGWAYLPNGLLMKWGRVLAPSAAIFTVDVAATSGGPTYTATTSIFQTYLTSSYSGSVTNSPSIPVLAAGAITSAGNFNAFVSNWNSTTSYFNYLVIGV